MRAIQVAPAIFFAIAHILAGVLYYFFLIWASTRLDLADFGELNSWMAYFSIALSIGFFAQVGSNFFIANKNHLKIMSLLTLLIGAVSLYLPWIFPQSSFFMVGLLGSILGILFSWFVGQSQIQLAFGVIGVGLLINGLAKFFLVGWEYPVNDEGLKFAWATSLSYSPGLLWIALAILIRSKNWLNPDITHRLQTRRIVATALLALTSVVIPQMDIIVVHQTQNPIDVGHFARISLLYKSIFFGFLIFMQWLLPQQMSNTKEGEKVTTWLGLYPWRPLLLSSTLSSVAFFSFVLFKQLGYYFFELDEKIVGLTCLNMALLTNIYFFIQFFCVNNYLLLAFAILALFLFEIGSGILLSFSILQNLMILVPFHFLVWTLISFYIQRLMKKKKEIAPLI
ncbi:MAG: hypothetical protein K1X29_02865 [Bdellovibrionales bacterium]|nr:hypothetical protein [Bdellovibrionales bacterium]